MVVESVKKPSLDKAEQLRQRSGGDGVKTCFEPLRAASVTPFSDRGMRDWLTGVLTLFILLPTLTTGQLSFAHAFTRSLALLIVARVWWRPRWLAEAAAKDFVYRVFFVVGVTELATARAIFEARVPWPAEIGLAYWGVPLFPSAVLGLAGLYYVLANIRMRANQNSARVTLENLPIHSTLLDHQKMWGEIDGDAARARQKLLSNTATSCQHSSDTLYHLEVLLRFFVAGIMLELFCAGAPAMSHFLSSSATYLLLALALAEAPRRLRQEFDAPCPHWQRTPPLIVELK